MTHLEKIIQNASFGYAWCRLLTDNNNRPYDYEFLDLNQAFADIGGYKARDLLGKRALRDIFGPVQEDLDWITFYGNVALNGGNESFEYYSGETRRWFLGQASGLGDGTFTVIYTDITEQKLAEQALLEERKLFSGGPVTTLIWTNDESRSVRYVSENIFPLLGYTQMEFYTPEFSFMELIHPEDRDRIRREANE